MNGRLAATGGQVGSAAMPASANRGDPTLPFSLPSLSPASPGSPVTGRDAADAIGSSIARSRGDLFSFPSSHALPLFVCAKCGVHLALQDEVISKAFSGRDGKAYLFHSSVNTYVGEPEDRRLLTGMHTVADLNCRGCDALVGWTYLKAWEGSQKYKEGESPR